ncbi:MULTISPECIES: hypothetical protein [Hyphomicrobiales]|uniref:hypothetical protein n=1 Tax=Hyphomicrobiales TaxID=356 RepID=UPI000F6763C9|nr:MULTISPECIES: hypothetical protein [Hyphomicrobiales]MCQ9147373.1 hypothetical protein [Ochrobactrum sp. BTU2]MDH1270309.1 hypothetical protein [Agrobacterium pusense]RSC24745.1 hypothetical protein EGT36_28365 [Agrobacterium sp. FDAARGOS_525]
MADEIVSYTSDNWRFTGEPLNGILGLHGTVMLIGPTFILFGMIWQFTKINLWMFFIAFWVIYILLAIYAKITGFTPRDTLMRLIIRLGFRGRYRV